ncbi:hypothetical protein [Flagellimonas algicola]|uniref:Uncharacterized protein n=1 Tax=Flagellimonas algicola TaxID=2583815 RepID=A0ABY2WGL5_9FLAO|nr:hypothetical protein [Allomuricauda algicola]TMU50691.1 hypothetical protein FGG15_17985 [Allomuricauda algicola]
MSNGLLLFLMLFSAEKMAFIKPNNGNKFVVCKFAEEHTVHPSVIYGFYLHDGKEEEKKKLYPLNTDIAPSVQLPPSGPLKRTLG